MDGPRGTTQGSVARGESSPRNTGAVLHREQSASEVDSVRQGLASPTRPRRAGGEAGGSGACVLTTMPTKRGVLLCGDQPG